MAVSLAVCEIFGVKKWCDLENKGFVQGHWKWHHLINRIEFLLAFHSNYGAILYRLWDIASYWSKITNYLYPTCIFSVPAGGDPVGILWRCLMLIKLKWLGYCVVKKIWKYVKSFFIEYWNATEKTNGRTDRQNCYINIVRQCADVIWNPHAIQITTKSWLFLEGYTLPMPAKFGRRPFPRSVIMFTEWQNDHITSALLVEVIKLGY